MTDFTIDRLSPAQRRVLLFLAGVAVILGVQFSPVIGDFTDINVSGALLPAMIAIGLFAACPAALPRGLLVVGIGIVVAHSCSGINEEGIGVDGHWIALTVGLSAAIFGGRWPRLVSYAAAALGTLIGADFLHMHGLRSGAEAVIGGAGIHDAVFLIPLWSLLVTCIALWCIDGDKHVGKTV